jgi:hypothetical protein
MDRPRWLTALHVLFTAGLVFVVLANGLAPYVGLKWEYSLAMFSGLRTDAGNHLFMPCLPLFAHGDYYVVEELTTPGGEALPSAVLLRDLLRRTGHPAGASADVRPVHRDLIRYHLARFRAVGVHATFRLRHADRGDVLTLAADTAPEAWLNYSVTLTYPLVRHSYAEIHEALAGHFRPRPAAR